MIVVSQNVLSPEIDNPFFYQVFQPASGGGSFAKKFCPGGWCNSPKLALLVCKFPHHVAGVKEQGKHEMTSVLSIHFR